MTGRTEIPLRWAGSKKRSLPHLRGRCPVSYDKYVELFAGSACLFFTLAPGTAHLNDNNPYVIDLYRAMQIDPQVVYQKFLEIPRNRDEYYRVRSALSQQTDLFTRSAHFYYLNRNCFNGIYRTNRLGQFNVPYSDSRVQSYLTLEQFVACSSQLRHISLSCMDFEDACRENLSARTFVYLDPPYYVPDKRTFVEYSAKHFAEVDFARLSTLLELIDATGAWFLMSYPDCPLVRTLSDRWRSDSIPVRRTVASRASFRQNTTELLISNF